MKKQFNVWQAVLFVIGLVLGSGLFYSAYLITAATNNPWLSLVCVAIGGIIILMLAQCFREINSGFKDNVFMPIWMRGLVGRRLGSYLAVNLSVVASPFVAVFMSYLFSQYLIPVFYVHNSAFLSNGNINVVGHATFVVTVAITAVVAFSLINTFSFAFGKWFQVIGTGFKLLPVFGVIIYGICVSNKSGFWNHPFAWNNPSQTIDAHTWIKVISLGIVASFFGFDGFYYAIRLGKNIKNPDRNVGKVMLISAVVLILIFFLFVYAALQIKKSGSIEFKEPWKNKILYVLFAWSSLVALNATTYTGCRIFQAIQKTKLLPKVVDLTKENSNGMAVNSGLACTLLNTLWAVVTFSIFLITKNLFFNNLITGLTSTFYFWFGIIALFALVNRFTKKVKTTVKVKGIAFYAIASFVACIYLTIYKVYSLYTPATTAMPHPHRVAFWMVIGSTLVVVAIWAVIELVWAKTGYRDLKDDQAIAKIQEK